VERIKAHGKVKTWNKKGMTNLANYSITKTKKNLGRKNRGQKKTRKPKRRMGKSVKNRKTWFKVPACAEEGTGMRKNCG